MGFAYNMQKERDLHGGSRLLSFKADIVFCVIVSLILPLNPFYDIIIYGFCTKKADSAKRIVLQ